MHSDSFKTSPHTPAHLVRAGAVYMITASTYQRVNYMQWEERRQELISAIQTAAEIHGWKVIAWVVLPDHYHMMVVAPQESALNLPKFIASYHKYTARRWNNEDRLPGRRVWWNYWDTCIRAEEDFLIRLGYIHWNPVKHGLVERPEDYSFSSYRQSLEGGFGD